MATDQNQEAVIPDVPVETPSETEEVTQVVQDPLPPEPPAPDPVPEPVVVPQPSLAERFGAAVLTFQEVSRQMTEAGQAVDVAKAGVEDAEGHLARAQAGVTAAEVVVTAKTSDRTKAITAGVAAGDALIAVIRDWQGSIQS